MIKIQESPPVWETEDTTPIQEVIDFLQQRDLPVKMSFSWRGSLFVFRTMEERITFTFGLVCCHTWEASETRVPAAGGVSPHTQRP